MTDTMEHKNPWSAFSSSNNSSDIRYLRKQVFDDHCIPSSSIHRLSISSVDSNQSQETILFSGRPSSLPSSSLHDTRENGASPHSPSLKAWSPSMTSSLERRISPEETGAVALDTEEADTGDIREDEETDLSTEQAQKHPQRQQEKEEQGDNNEGWSGPGHSRLLQQRSPTSLADSAVELMDTDRTTTFQSTATDGTPLDHGHDLYRSDSLDVSDAGFGSDIWRPSSLPLPLSLPAETEDKDDVLKLLVQKLQSEIADTRATVLDLESRLNAAENTNKHIVEELKMLLADAEGTLIGADDSDEGGGEGGGATRGSSTPKAVIGVEEDANVVYNRICSALQTLITDAQAALARTSTPSTTASASASSHALPLTPTTSSMACSASGRCNCAPYQHRLYSTSGGNLLLAGSHGGMRSKSSSLSSRTDPRGYVLDEKDHHNHHLYHLHTSLQPPSAAGSHTSRQTSSRRSSLAPPPHLYVTSRGTASHTTGYSSLYPSAIPAYPYYSAAQHQVPSEEFSRIRWKEKQQEQYERYRRSCDRVTLELELLLQDTWRAVRADEEAEKQHTHHQRRQNGAARRDHHALQFEQQQQSSTSTRHRPPSTLSSSSSTSPLSSGATTAVHSVAQSPTTANAPGQGGYEEENSEQQQEVSDKARTMRARLDKIQRLQRQYLSLSQASNDDLLQHSASTSSILRHDERHFSHHRDSHRHHHHSVLSTITTGSSSSSSNSTRSVATMPDSPPLLNPSKSLLVQLYNLWRQTELRTRFMHLLTTSVEALLAGWIMVKLAQWALTMMGVQYQKGLSDLMTYLYGHRDGAGASAKEMYERIRRDSARRRRLVEWKNSLSARLARWLTVGPAGTSSSSSVTTARGGEQKAAEALVSSISQAAAAAVQDDEAQRQAMMALSYPSTRMITDPVRRVAGHVVSGLVLALVVDQAKRLGRRL